MTGRDRNFRIQRASLDLLRLALNAEMFDAEEPAAELALLEACCGIVEDAQTGGLVMTDLANIAAVLLFAAQHRNRAKALELIDSIQIGTSISLLEGLANEGDTDR